MKKILTILLILGMILPMHLMLKEKIKLQRFLKQQNLKRKNQVNLMFISIIVQRQRLVDIVI